MGINSELLKTNNIISYFDNLKLISNKIILIAVKDIIGNFLSHDIYSKMQYIGLKADLVGAGHKGYIAVIDDSNVIFELLGKENTPIKHCSSLHNLTFEINSSPFNAGNQASIKINNVEHAINARGLNIVVIDKTSNLILDSVSFDTYLPNMPCIRNAIWSETNVYNYLNGLSRFKDKLIIISVKDTLEGINSQMCQSLKALGLMTNLTGKNWCSYIAIIHKGLVIHEHLGAESICTKCHIDMKSFSVDVHSAPYFSGNYALINIGAVQCAVNSRGLNIVIFDDDNMQIIDSVSFDTFIPHVPCFRKNCSGYNPKLFTYKLELAMMSQMELNINNQINRLTNSIKEENAHDEQKFWALYKKPCESHLNASKRFFRSMSCMDDEMSLIQKFTKELLHQLDIICVKHKIDYWLDWGSLIGAVRHKNCIPWDDDIDVGMMREDFDRLCSIMHLHPQFEVKIAEGKQDGYIRYNRFMLADSDIPCFIDIFPFDYADSVEEAWTQHVSLRHELIAKSNELHSQIGSTARNSRITALLDDYINKHIYLINPTNQKSAIVWGVENCSLLNRKISFAYDDIFPTKRIRVGETTCMAPRKTMQRLKAFYGNIYKLPNDMVSHRHVHLTNKQIANIKEFINED